MNEEFIKEIIKSTISGEPHLGTNLKEQCLMYFDNLISENKQLKQQLERSEKAKKEAIELINNINDWEICSKYDCMYKDDVLDVLRMLDIDKGDE